MSYPFDWNDVDAELEALVEAIDEARPEVTVPDPLLSADREREALQGALDDVPVPAARSYVMGGGSSKAMADALIANLAERGFTVASLSFPETTPAGVLDRKRTWPSRDEFRRMTPAEVNRFLESIGVSTRVVDPVTPAGVLDEAAIERLLATLTDHFHEARAGTPEWRDGIRLGLEIAMNEIGYATVPALAAALRRSGSGGGRG